jgi:hypothetical protein
MSGLFELFYNGVGEKVSHPNPLDPLLQTKLQRGQVFTRHQFYASFGLNSEITPRLTGQLTLIKNHTDASQIVRLHGQYFISNQQQAVFGAQQGWGSINSEWQSPLSVYLQSQWHF